MTWIYVWTSAIKNVYVWTTAAKAVYVGTTKVRPNWWDMSKWTLAQTSSALPWTWYWWVFFNPTWTKIFITWNSRVYESSLSTPFDLSQFSTSKYLSIHAEDIHFSTDGTKMYLLDEASASSTVYEYKLSTAWDISTYQYTGYLGWFNGYCRWLYITPDGKTMYVTIRNSTTYYKVSMSTAWTISTHWSISSLTSSIWWLSLWIGNDGKFAAWWDDESENTLRYGTLTTAYNLSTATSIWTKNVWTTRAWWIWFNDEWTICVIVWWWGNTNYITKYTL